MQNRVARLVLFTIFVSLVANSCRSTEERYYIRAAIPKGTSVAILIQGENDVKNAAFTEFLKAGYTVKAINASDFYRIDDVFQVKDLKRTQFVTSVLDKTTADGTAAVADKFFENLYKLHLYNFEAAKAEIMTDLKRKYKVDYVVLLAMSDWDKGYSWARVINLDTFDLVYVHNYPAKRADNVQTIIDRFIETMQKGQNSK